MRAAETLQTWDEFGRHLTFCAGFQVHEEEPKEELAGGAI